MADRHNLGEFDLIRRYLAPLASDAPLAFGLTDDAAVIRPEPGDDIVVTKDAIVSNVHFLESDPPERVAQKLLRVNLSDLAAMGAEPKAYLVAAVLPRSVDADWVAAFASGLAEDQRRFGVSLIGGDTVSTDGPLSLSLTAFGRVPRGTALKRSGARVGDDVYVSGTIGDGALGLKAVRGDLKPGGDQRDFLIRRYQRPEPRVTLGPKLIGLASSAIDISDGLVADLQHICDTSRCAITVELARVPLSEAAKSALAQDIALLETILSGGDDYELAFTVDPSKTEELLHRADSLHADVTKIGTVSDGGNVTVVDRNGAPMALPAPGYCHF